MTKIAETVVMFVWAVVQIVDTSAKNDRTFSLAKSFSAH